MDRLAFLSCFHQDPFPETGTVQIAEEEQDHIFQAPLYIQTAAFSCFNLLYPLQTFPPTSQKRRLHFPERKPPKHESFSSRDFAQNTQAPT